MFCLEPIACPRCLVHLNEFEQTLVCPKCTNVYKMQSGGFYDLRLDQTEYLDWMSSSPEAMTTYIDIIAPSEIAGAQHMIRNYLLGILKSINFPLGGKILSVGCGGGWDVGALQQMGYDAWGVDNGSRRHLWEKHSHKNFLYLADAIHLPFINHYFDFVFAEGVIEHIGFSGDGHRINPNWQEQRKEFIDSILRVTKPGGGVLLAFPNRNFPIDFFHGGNLYFGIMMRFHSYRERFLLSFQDIKFLLGDTVSELKALSLKGFFNLNSGLQKGFLRKTLFSAADNTFGLLPSFFWRTPLSPYIVVLARKK